MKYIATLVVGLLLLLPSATFAATPEEQYQSIVNQLIALLTEQVQVLQAQLLALQEQDTHTQHNSSPEPVLGATIHTMTTLKGYASINGDAAYYGPKGSKVKVEGTVHGESPTITATLLKQSVVHTPGQADTYTDAVDSGEITIEQDGDSFSFEFPATEKSEGNPETLTSARIDIADGDKTDSVVVGHGQFNLSF